MDSEQWTTLTAVVDRIVPRDDFPSASEAGVLTFFERLIPQQGLVETYAKGLDAIDAFAKDHRGHPFVSLDEAAQDEVLDRIENSGTEAAAFFRLVTDQTIEGYYSDPGNGGNRDGVAWVMIGFRVTA